MAKPVEFWFDFASPYSFIAAHRLLSTSVAEGLEINWQPFLVGVVLSRKTKGLSNTQLVTEAEAAYRRHDVKRTCDELGIPLRWPSNYPRGSMLAGRIAFGAIGETWLEPFVGSVFAANFLHDRDIGSEAVIADILKGLDMDPVSTIASATTDAAKAAFRDHVEHAITRGVFGAPMFAVDNELFWGNDRLEQAAAWAAGRRPAMTQNAGPAS